MNKTLYQKIVVFSLLFLFLSSFLVRELHPLFIHEHTHVQKICASEKGQNHIHSDEYAPEHCDFCGISVAFTDFLGFKFVSSLPIPPVFSQIFFDFSSIKSATNVRQLHLRGPPIL
jgi:hypothetical protein